MKKNKKILIMILTICIAIFMSGCYSACLKNSISSSPKSNNQVLTFKLSKSNKVKVDYESSVKKGTLKLKLIDSNGEIIESFETNKSGTKEIKIKQAGNYILSAEYKNFVGSFKLGVK